MTFGRACQARPCNPFEATQSQPKTSEFRWSSPLLVTFRHHLVSTRKYVYSISKKKKCVFKKGINSSSTLTLHSPTSATRSTSAPSNNTGDVKPRMRQAGEAHVSGRVVAIEFAPKEKGLRLAAASTSQVRCRLPPETLHVFRYSPPCVLSFFSMAVELDTAVMALTCNQKSSPQLTRESFFHVNFYGSE